MNKSENNCIRNCANVNLINRGIQEIDELSKIIEMSADVFKLLGNDVRLKILLLIKNEGKVCVCDLSDILEISISAISQHLRKLKDGNLLINKKEGQTIYYQIHPLHNNLLEFVFSQITHKNNQNVA